MPALRCCVVIPARLASTRLPGKMLLSETGKPLVAHTYAAASRAALAERVIVATDSDEIRLAVEAAGGEAVMTSPACQSGTDRAAEVVKLLAGFDIIVNVQGDEPEIEPPAIDLAVELLGSHPGAQMSTLATPIRESSVLADPNCVKVARAADGRALYFSRSPIPAIRGSEPTGIADPSIHLLHVGLYAYRRESLLRLARLPPSPLEQAEKLEQLRAIEAGMTILVGQVDRATPGIDTEADYRAFVDRQRARDQP